MPPDFLNSREDAVLLWVLVIVAFAFYKDPHGIGSSFVAVLRALLHWKLLLLYATVGAYCAAVVYAAEALGIWHTTALKATVYCVGTAIVVIGEAVSDASPADPEFLGRVLRRVAAVTVVIEFVVNLYVLPFLVEAFVLMVVLLFVGMRAAMNSGFAPAVQATRNFIEIVLGAVGAIYFAYFLIRVLTDLSGFFTRENAEDFLVGPTLSIALIPLLYAAALLSRWDQNRVRKRWRSASNSPA